MEMNSVHCFECIYDVSSEPSLNLYKFTNHVFINVFDNIFIIYLDFVASTFILLEMRTVICFL